MKPIPAIFRNEQEAELHELRRAVTDLNAAEAKAEKLGEQAKKLVKQADDARAVAATRRLEIGRMLVKARPRWPERGPKAKGWGEYLAAIPLAETTAARYMQEAREADGQDFPHSGRMGETHPDLPETSLPETRKVEPAELAGATQPATEAPELGAPPPTPVAVEPDVAGNEDDEDDIDRDTWCTPRWLTTAIGEVDRDPCANERSHVLARETFRLDYNQDGIALAQTVDPDELHYINPPYSGVLPWIQAYRHTRFIFLLKLDPSTKWFAELIAHTDLILIPLGTRVQFEPPPGVPPKKALANQFPHALFYSRHEDATPEILALCFAWRVDRDIAA